MLLHQQKAIHFSIQKIPRNPALQARLARKSVKSVPCRRRTLGFVIRISCSDGWPWLRVIIGDFYSDYIMVINGDEWLIVAKHMMNNGYNLLFRWDHTFHIWGYKMLQHL